ncbi:hypothetical protein [Lihuaxuella thermophila]|uniref:Uncharacterized protein n=1 Tax=Lihuaxuella thermophila TaxID=1173111 RepID=A0A1H8JBE7_9BACL|nr:hypothetical protein [Lihuaxuella thermophila]SEN77656.1 hypothetical protein SAMN05444955_12310 [Lihuaxuella thermophila]
MINKTTLTWTLSAVIYLVLVIGGYLLIDAWVGETDPHNRHSGQSYFVNHSGSDQTKGKCGESEEWS